ncbi:MAG: cytochrome b/b6 domain-containing protein [Anaerolineales bacterium]|nr:cytochrome b/b6 domain-containing protein [Anaerolineales bacterium]
MTRTTRDSKSKTYIRFDIVQRIQHITFLISFTVLGFTGLPQKFPLSPISVGFFNFLGGVENVRIIHHTSAIVMMIVSVFHVLEILYRVLVLRTPISMIPWINDAIHVYEDVLYYIGRRKHKAYYGRYSYAEKAEYLALIWGTVVMGLTGFMMWNPISTLRFLPGESVPAAKAAHGGEAILAVLAIIIWHFYHVHIKQLNKSMLTGTLNREEMEHEHPGELARIDSGEHLTPIPGPVLRKRQMIYMPIAIVILAVFSYGFYYFVGYETTAVTTLPVGATVQVYVPQTATPMPTATATPTKSVTPTPSSADAATEAPAASAVTWDSAIGPLFTQKCLMCHGATASGGLNLSTYADAIKGGANGVAFTAGDSAGSLMIVKFEGGKHSYAVLTPEELAQIKIWLDAGALEK